VVSKTNPLDHVSLSGNGARQILQYIKNIIPE